MIITIYFYITYRFIVNFELIMTCSICISPLNEALTCCPQCFSVFHKECTDKSIQINNKCPKCNQNTTFKNIPENSFITNAANIMYQLNGIDILSLIQSIKDYGIDIEPDEIVKMSFLYTEFNDLLETIDAKTKILKSEQKIHHPESIDAHYKLRQKRLEKQEAKHQDDVSKFNKLVSDTVDDIIESRRNEFDAWEKTLLKREKTLSTDELKFMGIKAKYDKFIADSKKKILALETNTSIISKSKELKRNHKLDDTKELLASVRQENEKYKKEIDKLRDELEHVKRISVESRNRTLNFGEGMIISHV